MMNDVEAICAGYFYKSNFGFIIPSRWISPEKCMEIRKIVNLTEKILKEIMRVSGDFGLKITPSIGCINIAESRRQITYLAIGQELKDKECIIPSIYNYLSIIGLEKPLIDNFFLYYHPPIKVIVDNNIVQVVPRDCTLLKKDNLDVKPQLKINTYKVDLETIKLMVRAIIRQSLWEKAISAPSEKAVEWYSEEIFRRIHEKEKKSIILRVAEIKEIILEKMQSLMNRIRGELKEEIDLMEELMDKLV